MSEILRTETLGKVRDGALAMVLDERLADIFEDCYDRPGVRTARTVTLEISVSPRMPDPDEIDLTGALIAFSVSSKLPKQRISRTMQASRKNKGFRFEADTDSTEPDPHSRTFEFDEDENHS